MNALRELRLGLHSGAVLAAGLAPLEALSLKTPGMAPLFGWADLADVTDVQPRWDDAEAATNRAMAHAFAELDGAERAELSDLAGALQQATAS